MQKKAKTSYSHCHTDFLGSVFYVCACLNFFFLFQGWWQSVNVSKGHKTRHPWEKHSILLHCQKETTGKHSLPSINPSPPPSQHFPALGLSLLCIWVVVIMAGCLSRKVWPRFTLWEEQWVEWWGYLSPVPIGLILPSRNCWPGRQEWAGECKAKGVR